MGLLSFFKRKTISPRTLLGKEKVDLAKQINKDFEASRTANKTNHELWRKLDRYYNCEFWDDQRPSWRMNPATNYVYKQVQQKKSMVCRTSIEPMCMPIEDDIQNEERQKVTKLFNGVLRFIDKKIGLNDDFKDELVETAILFGGSPAKIYWDNDIYGGSKEKGSLWVGEVAAECIDPANFYYDPRAFNIQDCRYIDIVTPKTREFFKARWPEQYQEVKEGGTGNVNQVKIYDRPEDRVKNDEELLHEYWWKENGGVHVAYIAGDVVLEVIENVYAHGKYPFVVFRPKFKRKSMMGMPEPKQLMGNQESLNKVLDLKLINLMLTANRQKIVNQNAGVDIKKLTNEPGLVIPVNGDVNTAMRYDTPPPLPSEFFQSENQLREDMKDIGGIYEAATGEAPGKVTAASAIAMLQEQASIPIEDIIRQLLKTYKEIYWHIIELVKENYTESRLIRLMGEDDAEEIIRFRGSDYADVEFEVNVQATSSATMTKAYLAELGNQLFQQGLLLPEEYIEFIDFPGKERVIDRLKKQQKEAEQQPQIKNPTTFTLKFNDTGHEIDLTTEDMNSLPQMTQLVSQLLGVAQQTNPAFQQQQYLQQQQIMQGLANQNMGGEP